MPIAKYAADLPNGHHQGIVPGGDEANHTQGLAA